MGNKIFGKEDAGGAGGVTTLDELLEDELEEFDEDELDEDDEVLEELSLLDCDSSPLDEDASPSLVCDEDEPPEGKRPVTLSKISAQPPSPVTPKLKSAKVSSVHQVFFHFCIKHLLSKASPCNRLEFIIYFFV